MTRLRLLGVLTAFTMMSSGCARAIILHPIEKSDIVSMPKGIAYAPEKDGWFLSDFVLKEVENAKVESAKKTS